MESLSVTYGRDRGEFEMSRIGKMPVPLPKGVEAKVEQNKIFVKGPKGSLEQEFLPCVEVSVKDGEVIVSLAKGHEEEGKFHGLYRSLISNMVVGVSTGFEKVLEMQGVGYRASVKGQSVDLQVGFSHPTLLTIPEGISVKVEKNTVIHVSGVDKQKVGQFAAEIRAKRPPEPYKGKGVRYQGEYVRRKAGKAAKK